MTSAGGRPLIRLSEKGIAMTAEKQARAASGWPMLFVTLAAYAASLWGMVQGIIILAMAEGALRQRAAYHVGYGAVHSVS